MSIHLLAAALLSLLFALPAQAVEVFVNGVKVTGGIRDTGFDNVNVKFDAQGNVHVDAPGYKIQVAPQPAPITPTAPPAAAPPAAAPPAAVPPAVRPPVAPPVVAPPVSTGRTAPPVARPQGERTWLVVNTKMTGHFKLLVQANGVQVAEIPAASPQYIADITDKLRPGQNQVQITYLPSPNAPAVPATEAVSVMVGRGTTGADGTLTIGRVLGTHKKETGNPSADAATIQFKL